METSGINPAIHIIYHNVSVINLLWIVYTLTTTHKETWSVTSRHTVIQLTRNCALLPYLNSHTLIRNLITVYNVHPMCLCLKETAISWLQLVWKIQKPFIISVPLCQLLISTVSPLLVSTSHFRVDPISINKAQCTTWPPFVSTSHCTICPISVSINTVQSAHYQSVPHILQSVEHVSVNHTVQSVLCRSVPQNLHSVHCLLIPNIVHSVHCLSVAQSVKAI